MSWEHRPVTPTATASNTPAGDVLTLADIDRLRARLRPCRFPFMVPGFGYPGGAVLVVATDEQIAQAELNGFLRRVTDESDTP